MQMINTKNYKPAHCLGMVGDLFHLYVIKERKFRNPQRKNVFNFIVFCYFQIKQSFLRHIKQMLLMDKTNVLINVLDQLDNLDWESIQNKLLVMFPY